MCEGQFFPVLPCVVLRHFNRRELNKVYTNGTLVDEELLTDEQAGHCISIREETCDSGEGSRKDDNDGGKTFGICVLDSATSEFGLSAFEDDVCRTKLETLLRQLRPKEIVFTKVVYFSSSPSFIRPDYTPIKGKLVCVNNSLAKGHSPRRLSLDELKGK